MSKKHTTRTKRAIKLWKKIDKDYSNFMSVKDIAIKHNRSESHVYYALAQIRKRK